MTTASSTSTTNHPALAAFTMALMHASALIGLTFASKTFSIPRYSAYTTMVMILGSLSLVLLIYFVGHNIVEKVTKAAKQPKGKLYNLGIHLLRVVAITDCLALTALLLSILSR